MNARILSRFLFTLFLATPLLLALVLTGRVASAEIVSSTTVQDCTTDDGNLHCDAKTVTSVSVSYGHNQYFELIPRGTIKVEPSEPQSLVEGIKVEVWKTQPRIIYPLIYDRTVEYDPAEKDSYSAGLNFHGYRIGAPTTSYEVEFIVTKGRTVKKFSVSPEAPVYASMHDDNYQPGAEVKHFKAELVGEQAPARVVPDYSNYMLFIAVRKDPDKPSKNHPYANDYPHHLLLVPLEEISHMGTECDKVGYISKNFGQHKQGHCLDNQLYDMLEADISRQNTNPELDTDYLVSGMKIFKESMEFIPDMAKVLEVKQKDLVYSQVTLTSDLYEVRSVVTESVGYIVDRYVEPFESMSRNGRMVVVIENQGGLRTNYIVTVTECDFNIVEAIPAQSRTLFPREQETLYFDIYSQYSLEETNMCKVKMHGANGKVYDGPLEVYFDTVPHRTEKLIPRWDEP